ncbi:LacI family transcriptional regulator [Pigmentiphaga kullae]|uniref:LacI family transcriptional regulator n=2 Tax=Pigmentiphaga kullae TaxID=151784 RepID=A0A4Q7N7Q6_9BURK|nr:LacI family transcriptional regulator [Pigmentiphaga kullae]
MKKTANDRVRMVDVARLANVAPITVSRALSHPSSVAPETLDKIHRVIKQLGYVPNGPAGSLKSQKTQLIAAVIPSINHLFLTAMVQGVSDFLSPLGYHLMLGTSGETLEGEEAIVRAFLSQRPRALLLHNTVHTAECIDLIRASGIPVIETGDLCEQPLDTAVGFSNFDAAYTLTRHLIDRGYENIACVYARSPHNERTQTRIKAYRAAVNDAGLRSGPDLEIATDGDVASGAVVLRDLIDARPQVDAAVFFGGNMALGAHLECQKMRVPIPGRIAIVAFEDTEMGAMLAPAITALRIPRYAIGREAARVALARIGGGSPSGHVDVGFELRIRETS